MAGSFLNLLLVALSVISLAGAAAAAPGDPRVLQGTLEWPATYDADRFIIIRGTDGALYYADVSGAERRVRELVQAGERISVIGVEARQPFEIAATVVGAGDAALAAVAPGTPRPRTTPSAPPGGAESRARESWQRIEGTIQSVASDVVAVKTPSGETVSIDASTLGAGARRALRRGEAVTVFARTDDGGRLVATGLMHVEPPPPAALPRSTR
jgi:hypothetical protein